MIEINKRNRQYHIGVGRRRFSLLEIYHNIIDEVFDFETINKYELSSTSDSWKFEADINGDIVPVFVYVEPTEIQRFDISPNIMDRFRNNVRIFNFGFEIGDSKISSQYTKTTYKYYIRILATVGNALNKFIESTNPDIITFFSESKRGGNSVDIQKDDVYFKAMDRNKPAGYEIESISDRIDHKPGIMLYKR